MPEAMNTRNFVTIICAAILIGAEVFGLAFAAGWAIAGMFELGRTVQYGLMGVFSLIGVYVMWKFVQGANKVEPIWTK
jgi:membrane protein implicated in regulation of membrane protease activity